MMIDITGVNLREFVKKVYDLSQPQGMGFLHFTPESLTDKEADAIIDICKADKNIALHMGYVNGRACKMVVFRMGDKLEIRDSWYDHSDYALEALLKHCEILVEKKEAK